jgi:hypothetical protein
MLGVQHQAAAAGGGSWPRNRPPFQASRSLGQDETLGSKDPQVKSAQSGVAPPPRGVPPSRRLPACDLRRKPAARSCPAPRPVVKMDPARFTMGRSSWTGNSDECHYWLPNTASTDIGSRPQGVTTDTTAWSGLLGDRLKTRVCGRRLPFAFRAAGPGTRRAAGLPRPEPRPGRRPCRCRDTHRPRRSLAAPRTCS